MTAFDHFQTATCLIAEGKRDDAARHIDMALGSLLGRRAADESLIAELRTLRRSLSQ